MRQTLKALFGSSRTNRLGWALGIVVLTLTIIVRCITGFLKETSISNAEQARMSAAYLAWQSQNAKGQSPGLPAADLPAAGGSLFFFDPNTLDSESFIRLGMPPRAVKGLLNWRRHNKHFYKAEDLQPLYNLPPEVYARLAPYVRIEGGPPESGFRAAGSFAPVPAIIDLNSADSALLDRGLPGVGAILAHKIVRYRRALGGFTRYEQLMEVYRFPDTTFQRLKSKLSISQGDVRRFDLNKAGAADMAGHPYVGEQLAKNIILYREGIGHYSQVAQLRQVPLMNEEIYRKIAPYFRVD